MGLPSLSFLLSIVLLLWQYSKGCGACWTKEKVALLDIKATLCFPGTAWRTNWDIEDDCCRWNGVTRDAVEGRITGLELTSACSFNESVTTLLNATLFLPFYELHSLSLLWTNFNGCIPGYGMFCDAFIKK
jgi:Leucine rich repeat N-terminal domain